MYSLAIEDLSPELEELWLGLQHERRAELGPLLHPEYVRAVSAVRGGVEVGIITEDGEVRGFLPYRRSALNIALPLAGRLSDQAGAVVGAGTVWSPIAFAKALGLNGLRLPHTPTSDVSLRPFQSSTTTSAVIDVSRGFEFYSESQRASGSSLLGQAARLNRKAGREVGPSRFRWRCPDDEPWHELLEWKGQQRARTRTPDVLQLPWARALVERLRNTDVEGFGGVVSTLHFGDRLAAAHFGIHTDHTLHYWISAYNPEFSRFSPGITCLLGLVNAAADRGIQQVDLGVGDESFKDRMRTGTQELATTTVSAQVLVNAVFRTADDLRTWSRGSHVGRGLRTAKRAAVRSTYRLRRRLSKCPTVEATPDATPVD